MKTSAKIFVIYHIPSEAISTEVYCPICVGDLKDQFNEAFLRDDKGRNIAYKNNLR